LRNLRGFFYLASAAEFLEAKARRISPKDALLSYTTLPEAKILDSSEYSINEE
jgi:hypothetical protein